MRNFIQLCAERFGGVLAVAVLALLPVSVFADGIGFRNETQMPILVQGAAIQGPMIRRGQPIVVFPGKVGWDSNLTPGMTRIISIYDANQPGRLLLRQVIPFTGRDIRFIVRPDPINGAGKVVLVPQ